MQLLPFAITRDSGVPRQYRELGLVDVTLLVLAPPSPMHFMAARTSLRTVFDQIIDVFDQIIDLYAKVILKTLALICR